MAGIYRNDISTWQTAKIESVNLEFEIPKDVSIREFNFRDPHGLGTEKGASFALHKHVPEGFAEFRYIINIGIYRFDKNEWQSYVNSFQESNALKIYRDLTKTEDEYLFIYKKDIITNNGEVIRINGSVSKYLDLANIKTDTYTALKIINSMKPIKN